jgi:RNA polymerase primary sigma factor
MQLTDLPPLLVKLVDDAQIQGEILGSKIASVSHELDLDQQMSEKLLEELLVRKINLIDDDVIIEIENSDKASTGSALYGNNDVHKQSFGISAEKERTLAKKMHLGDRKAEQDLVTAYLPLVLSISSFYTNRGLGMEDLVQEGNLGLIQAVKRFDPNRKVRLSTYASFWIRSGIVKALCESKVLCVPLHVQNDISRLDRDKAKIATSDASEMRKSLEEKGWNNKKVADLEKYSQMTVISLDQTVEDSEIELGDLIGDESIDPALQAIFGQREKEIEEALSLLPAGNRSILCWRFGFGCAPKTLAECGAKMGVTRERARQIQNRALRYLRYAPEALNIRSAINNG